MPNLIDTLAAALAASVIAALSCQAIAPILANVPAGGLALAITPVIPLA